MGSALVVADAGDILDHGLMHDRIARTAGVLGRRGLIPGDVVALLSESSADAVEVLWAARHAGLVALPLDPSLSLEELAFAVNDSGAKVLLSSARFATIAESLPPLTPYVEARFSLDGVLDDHRSLALARSTAAPVPESGIKNGTLHYTASLTGRPAGFSVPDPIGDARGSEELRAILGEGAVVDASTVLATVSPVSDAVSAQLIAAVHAVGGTVVTIKRATPERLVHAIATYEATHVHLTPVVAVKLAKLSTSVRRPAETSSIRRAVFSSPSCPHDAIAVLAAWWGPVVRQLFVSPGVGVVCAADGVEILGRPSSVGRPVRGWIDIVDDHGAVLPVGAEGQVRLVRGDERHLLRDRGFLDGTGQLHLADRDAYRAEVGLVVTPREIENLLAAHPAVAGAAVIGLADRWASRGVGVFVEVANGVRPDPALERDLIDHLRRSVPPECVPAQIDFTAKLPRTASGKLDKRRLTPRDGLGVGALY